MSSRVKRFLKRFGSSGNAAPTQHAVPAVERPDGQPQVASVGVVANVTDPGVNRDSGCSVRFGDRTLWVWRDSQPFVNGKALLPLIMNSASWTGFDPDGTPAIGHGAVGQGSNGNNSILQAYGGAPTSLPPYFPIPRNDVQASGLCEDNSRWVLWPDAPPMVAEMSNDGTVTAYNFIAQSHLKGLENLNPQPPFALFKLTYSPLTNRNILPNVSVVHEAFHPAGSIGYGAYGHVVRNGTAYLYGKLSLTDGSHPTALAKVPVESIEDPRAYEYWVRGRWSPQRPSISDHDAAIYWAGAGGQGTFYWSDYFSSYIFIGQAGISISAEFFLTMAPEPQGPWIEPYSIYKGEDGTEPLSSYSLQAHPGLMWNEGRQGGIYLSWTQNCKDFYNTPLVWVKWR